MKWGLFLALALAVVPAAAAEAPQIARHTWLVPGDFAPGRQPDGNSVVWQGPGGLVVLDTGRHADHAAAIMALADLRGAPVVAPVVAIVNSHWHLDHVSGNPRLKARWPKATVYASAAIDGALTGFLAKSAASSRALLAAGKLPPDVAQDVKGDLATIERGAALKPDIVIGKSQTLSLAGRRLTLNLTRGATDGDIWIYDPATRLVAAGDLVTLPVPFLDTADPMAWSRALKAIAATGFVTLVPGHGAPMDRHGFARYARAFDRLIACAATRDDAVVCEDGWIADAGPLLAADDQKRARAMIGYYVGQLRKS